MESEEFANKVNKSGIRCVPILFSSTIISVSIKILSRRTLSAFSGRKSTINIKLYEFYSRNLLAI